MPSTGRSRLAFGATAVLVGMIVAIGLWPNPAMEGARLAAADVTDTGRYVEAVGLAGETP